MNRRTAPLTSNYERDTIDTIGATIDRDIDDFAITLDPTGRQ